MQMPPPWDHEDCMKLIVKITVAEGWLSGALEHEDQVLTGKEHVDLQHQWPDWILARESSIEPYFMRNRGDSLGDTKEDDHS